MQKKGKLGNLNVSEKLRLATNTNTDIETLRGYKSGQLVH